jgi:hypothetical protein
MQLYLGGALVAENNIIHNIPADRAIWWNNCESIKFSNNQTHGGRLLSGFNNAENLYTQELEDTVDDVNMLL